MKIANSSSPLPASIPKLAAPLRLLTPEQVAVALVWHEESVRRALRQGRIKGIRVGRNWRIELSVLEAISRSGL